LISEDHQIGGGHISAVFVDVMHNVAKIGTITRPTRPDNISADTSMISRGTIEFTKRFKISRVTKGATVRGPSGKDTTTTDMYCTVTHRAHSSVRLPSCRVNSHAVQCFSYPLPGYHVEVGKVVDPQFLFSILVFQRLLVFITKSMPSAHVCTSNYFIKLYYLVSILSILLNVTYTHLRAEDGALTNGHPRVAIEGGASPAPGPVVSIPRPGGDRDRGSCVTYSFPHNTGGKISPSQTSVVLLLPLQTKAFKMAVMGNTLGAPMSPVTWMSPVGGSN
jgi:hypothetical protein